MKKRMSLLLLFAILLSLCGCQGNFGKVELQDTIAIPEDGIIQQAIFSQIKSDNAIGVFAGESEGLHYEWVIFGSDIAACKDVNLAVRITKGSGGDILIDLAAKEPFGFSALLSVYLDEAWQAQSATAYAGDQEFASVSITGSKATVLNLTLGGTCEQLVIRPDPLPEESENPAPAESKPAQNLENPVVPPNPPMEEDDYLSKSEDGDDTIYTDGQGQNPSAPSQNPNQSANPPTGEDDYLSKPEDGDDTVYTDGKDKYQTDPIPEGKPKPVEPEDQDVDKGKTYTCTFSIECSTILNNLDMLDPDKLEMVPSNGVILAKTTVTFYEGESVFDVLQRVCQQYGIHMESSWTPIYNSAYIEGIHNLYEFDCGSLSGWMYRVNGWYPNYGCSRYQLKDGDTVEWRYTCDLGNDIGGGYATGG